MIVEKLAVVIPVYNESEIISTVINDWIRALDAIALEFQTFKYQLFLYNDGSKDSTSNILHKLENVFCDKICVFDEKNSGHGPTILKGYRKAIQENYDWIFQVDSDNEMPPDMFHELWKKRHDFDFLVGKRDSRQQQLPRKIISLCSRLTVHFLYGKSVWDVNSPYRLMRVAAMREIMLSIPSDTLAPNVIISGMAARNKLRCCELPCKQRERQTGTVSIKRWKLFNFALRSFSQTVDFSLKSKNAHLLFFAVAILSLIAKIAIASRGWNYDYESYKIVADIMRRGGNVYAETSRYNYGPGWFNIVYCLSVIAGSYFRYAFPIFLGLTDIGIAYILWKKFHFRIASLLFLLSPLVIQISGYHNQFDNVAVFLTLYAVTILPNSSVSPSWSSVFKSSLIIGTALAIKHVFIFFVFWFLFRSWEWKKKILLCIIPLTIFSASFIPYLYPWEKLTFARIKQDITFVEKHVHLFKENNMTFTNKQKAEIKNYSNRCFLPVIGFMKNVVCYKSYNNCILYTYFMPRVIQKICSPFLLFIAGILINGWLCRKSTLFNMFAFYTLCLVLFSTATTNQYLVIPSVFTCVYYLPFGIVYNLIPGMYFLKNCAATYVPYIYIVSTGLLLLMYFHFIYTPEDKR